MLLRLRYGVVRVMRISQHGHDVIYSIMGLFAVNLPYDEESTPEKLMVELCEQILAQGGGAN